jgi:hypothetical protein
MLEGMQNLGEFDAIFFMPTDKNNIHIQSNVYKNKGTPVENSTVGDKWHIILFQEDDEENDEELVIKNFDTFEAIFSDPREYISDLIKSGWYGIISRKTTTSDKFYQDALAKFEDI